MKKALHIVKGKDIKYAEVAASKWGAFVFILATSRLDGGEDGSTVKIKLPVDVLNKLLRGCDLSITKKKIWWWVDEISPKQE